MDEQKPEENKVPETTGGKKILIAEDEKPLARVLSLKLTKAEKLAPGRYKIISGPDVTGVIAHEAFGHTQEGDTWMKGRSIAQNLRKAA